MSTDFAKFFKLSDQIRYVARYSDGRVRSAQRNGVAGASAGESDRYEELFINPALLTLGRQRGRLDCGGFKFVIVGYGNFLQLVIDLADGHLSVCFENSSNPLEYVDRLIAALGDD